MYSIVRITVLALLSLPVTALGMPILDVQGGLLFGVSNIDFDGTLYDVEFLDGTCAEVFDGCDNAVEDFVFPGDATKVSGALEALASQALDPNGYLLNIELIRGCPSGSTQCRISTFFAVPAGSNVPSYVSLTVLSGTFFTRTGNWDPITFDTTNTSFLFARWSVSPTTSVPEPTSAALLGLGLLGLGLARRRVKR